MFRHQQILPVGVGRRVVPALLDSVVLQLLLRVFVGLMWDGGFGLSLWTMALAGYWGGTALILLRRWRNPTGTDVFLVRWGFLFLFLLCLFVLPVLWSLVVKALNP